MNYSYKYTNFNCLHIISPSIINMRKCPNYVFIATINIECYQKLKTITYLGYFTWSQVYVTSSQSCMRNYEIISKNYFEKFEYQ